MLITNFAAGELSENLFGRTDLPQYFAGASRIENFDVIPTGGLRFRSGTERLARLETGGRFIPFVVNRALNFLLYLSPSKITVFKIADGALSGNPAVFNSGNNPRIYGSMEDIDGVQCAQNFDTMILCHENYPPLEVKLINNNLTINTLQMDFKKEVVCGAGTSASEAGSLDDGEYKANGRLRGTGHYPKSACFFNGRLVFAATKNEPQRLFFSSLKKTNNIYSFATVKVFLTEKKEYAVVCGSVTNGSNVINVTDGYMPSFTKSLGSYETESSFFNPAARINYISGNKIYLTGNCNISPVMDSTEIAALNVWKNDADAIVNGINSDYGHLVGNGVIPAHTYQYRMRLAVNRVRFLKLNFVENVVASTYFTITNSIAQMVFGLDRADAPMYFRNLFNSSWVELCEMTYETGGAVIQFVDNYDIVLRALYDQILAYRRYTVHGRTFYGTPDEIYQQVLAYNAGGTATYIPFRARDIIKDEYPTPDCGFTFEIASETNDAVRWLAVNKGLVVGTETGEWVIPPDVHATNATAVLNSRHGSDSIQGAAAGDAICFFRTGKKSLIEYCIPQADSYFRANDTAMLAPQMLSESQAREFDFLSSPYTKFLITREDGAMAALLYERSTGTFAWGRITTNGEIISAAVLPGPDGNDDAYLAVKRGGFYLLERMREACETYLDSYAPWTGDASEYAEGAVVYDEAENKTYALDCALPPAGGGRVIGCPYTGRARSMPVLANNRMKPNNIKNLLVRFMDSYMPKIKSLPNGAEDTIPLQEPYTGVYKIPFPGVWERDVMFEFAHGRPCRCGILSIFAEVN